MINSQYVLAMFPYPSGSGLHLGHWYNYAIIDSYCRWSRFRGQPTFQPFGYDAFGLPAENYAIKVGGDPRDITYKNIANFREEIKRMNTTYEELLITSDPSYYMWTQWIFLKMYEKGLAYKKYGPVNWCPSCATVLANEQCKAEVCERCNTKIETKELEQWYLRITDYKERLISGLNAIDYPEKTKKQQRHWLENLQDWCVSRQRKWGTPIPIDGETDTLDTFVDSSFYYLRYCDPTNANELAAKDKIKQVDLYVGGNEHACAHLIYARFVNMFLYDIGITPFEEPFKKVIHQGMISHSGEKMSKSKGNVIDPGGYNPDVLRMHLMFAGDYLLGFKWADSGIVGIERFINKLQTWLRLSGDNELDFDNLIKNIDSKVNRFRFNTIVSDLMKFYNQNKDLPLTETSKQKLIGILQCFMPEFDIV